MAGLPWATCWEMPSGGQFWYRFVRWRALPGPPAGKWAPEVSFRIDLYGGGASLGHLLEMASGGHWLAVLCHALPRFATICHVLPSCQVLLRLSCLALLCHAVHCLAELCHASFYISPHSTAAWLSIAWLYSIAKHRRSWLFMHSIVEHIIVKRS